MLFRSSPEPAGPSQEELDRDELNRLIAEIYVMEEEYTQWLEAAYQRAIDEYHALPKEKQTTVNKYAIGSKYMAKGLEKEKECDGKMASIENRLRVLLTRLGEGTGLVDQIDAAYKEEKSMKKAYYMGLHS